MVAPVLLLAPMIALAQSAPGPSKQETLDWLKGHLTQAVEYQTDDGQVFRSIHVHTFEDCRVTVIDTVRKGKRLSVHGMEVTLSDLDPAHIEVQRWYPEVWAVTANTRSKKPLVDLFQLRKADVKKLPPRSKRGQTTGIWFIFPSQELAQRVGRGIEHGIRVCGGKSEPF